MVASLPGSELPFGVPLTVSGLQKERQAPVQRTIPPRSWSLLYSARPCESTRTLPAPAIRLLDTVAPLLFDVLPPVVAATAIAIPTARAAAPTTPVISNRFPTCASLTRSHCFSPTTDAHVGRFLPGSDARSAQAGSRARG